MNRNDNGGSHPTIINQSPNVIRPIQNHELIDRRGEDAILLQLLPCPCPDSKKTPDCKYCYSGFIRVFQESLDIEDELINMDGIKGSSIYPRFYPIKSVNKIQLTLDGNTSDLPVSSINYDHIKLSDQTSLKYWNTVKASYKVDLIEKETVEIKGNGLLKLPLKLKNKIIVGIEDYFCEDDTIKPVGFNFDSLLFDKPTLDKFIRVKVKVITPIRIAYQTTKIDVGKTPNANLKVDVGDIDITLNHNYKVAEGDIITFLSMYLNANSRINYYPTKTDYLPYAPVKEIFHVFGIYNQKIKEYKEGIDFILESNEKIRWINEKPLDGYSIRYSYHPSYRIQNTGEGGGLENRNVVRTYHAKPVNSYRSFQ